MKPAAKARAARPRVVMLVDDKTRDLPVAALVAHHLEKSGVDCFLEPLEAYRAALGAHRPHLIVFNHLNASHLVAYSKRLAAMGVRVAVLPNEGIVYNREQLKFLSGRHHQGAHIDHFFCWNEQHRDALLASGFGAATKIEVVGVPRFDFYFEPWSRLLRPAPKRGRPRVLLCTNFPIAKLWQMPKAQADKFFAAWADRIPMFRNYWKSVESNFKARERVFGFAEALADADRFELVLRPHPREDPAIYAAWMEKLPAERRRWVRLEAQANISTLILESDLEVSCETCTTAVEAWVVGRPTIELIFDKDPMYYHPEHAAASLPCERPAELPGLVDRLLAEGEDARLLAARRQLLRKWCHAPDGTAAERMARSIGEALREAPEPDWSRLGLADRRRAAKLKLFRRLGLAYHFDPLLPVKLQLDPKRYAGKKYVDQKSIKPRDVARARAELVKALGRR